jgi:hypothetical protein
MSFSIYVGASGPASQESHLSHDVPTLTPSNRVVYAFFFNIDDTGPFLNKIKGVSLSSLPNESFSWQEVLACHGIQQTTLSFIGNCVKELCALKEIYVVWRDPSHTSRYTTDPTFMILCVLVKFNSEEVEIIICGILVGPDNFAD